jgi:hypothetical protein
MAHLITLYWRDIPAQVIAERGRGRKREQAKIELSRRFSIAIDAAAMRHGADSTDDYLAEWRRSEPKECGDDLDAAVATHSASLEAEYTSEKVRLLVENGGKAKDQLTAATAKLDGPSI